MGDVVFENGYEAEAWREIREWELRPEPRLAVALRRLTSPVGFVADRLVMRPVLGRSAERLGEGMRSAATSVGGRVDLDGVLKRTSGSVGRPVRTLEELRAVDLRTLDRMVAGADKKYIAAASASGGAAGAVSTIPGGSVLALGALGADVVASTALLLRAIAGYGTQYGRDMSTPAEAQFAVGLLSLGAVAGDAKAREELIGEVHEVGALMATGASWETLSRTPSVRALQAVFDRLGTRLTKRKLAQVVPFFGAAAGGTLGAALADHTCTTAYMQYRRRYLIDKYPELRAPPGRLLRR